MKLRSLIISAVVLSAVSVSSAAQALVVNFSGSNVNMGNLQNGQSGTITDIMSAVPNHLYQSLLNGALPKNSEVTFTYSFPSYYLIGSLDSKISYDFMQSGVHHNGSSEATSQTDVFFNTTDGLTQQGYLNGVAGVSQVFATAHLTTPGDGTATGTVTFTNYTQLFQNFTSQFLGAFNSLCDGHPIGTITYVVSSVPLPASLPVMLLAVAGLFGMSRMNRRKLTVA